MAETAITINETRIREEGRQLTQMAMVCEVLFAVVQLLIVLLSWFDAAQLPGYAGVRAELSARLLQPGGGLTVVHGVAQAACVLLVLELIRRWGHRLSGADPMGAAALAALARVKWAVLALAAVSCVSFTAQCSSAVSAGTTAMFPSGYGWGGWRFSFAPLLAGLIAAMLLSIAERVAATADVLRMENREFV